MERNGGKKGERESTDAKVKGGEVCSRAGMEEGMKTVTRWRSKKALIITPFMSKAFRRKVTDGAGGRVLFMMDANCGQGEELTEG